MVEKVPSLGASSLARLNPCKPLGSALRPANELAIAEEVRHAEPVAAKRIPGTGPVPDLLQRALYLCLPRRRESGAVQELSAPAQKGALGLRDSRQASKCLHYAGRR